MGDEQAARYEIDRLLQLAGWSVTDISQADIHGNRGTAIREFPLPGHGFVDYLLYVDGKAAGVIEAKKQGVTLSGVETQSAKYTAGLPVSLPAWSRPLPFSYQSTGVETRFTNALDPDPRSRPVFAFHRPETLRELLDLLPQGIGIPTGSRAVGLPLHRSPPTFLTRLRARPPLVEQGSGPPRSPPSRTWRNRSPPTSRAR